jgi:mannosyltransferase OCH1-like enzyme
LRRAGNSASHSIAASLTRNQYFESRALHAASAARIPDILHQAWLEGKSDGLTAEELSQKTGYEKNKCGANTLCIGCIQYNL